MFNPYGYTSVFKSGINESIAMHSNYVPFLIDGDLGMYLMLGVLAGDVFPMKGVQSGKAARFLQQ